MRPCVVAAAASPESEGTCASIDGCGGTAELFDERLRVERRLPARGAFAGWSMWRTSESESEAWRDGVWLAFCGEGQVPIRRCRKFFDHLRTSGIGSEWRRVSCAGPINQIVQLYIGPDKNRKQVQTEILSKKAATIIREEIPAARIHLLRAEGIVTLAWRPLCRLTVFPDGSFDLHWNPKALSTCGLNKAIVLEGLEGATVREGSDDIEWVL